MSLGGIDQRGFEFAAPDQHHIGLMTVRFHRVRDDLRHALGVTIAQRSAVLIENHTDLQLAVLQLVRESRNAAKAAKVPNPAR